MITDQHYFNIIRIVYIYIYYHQQSHNHSKRNEIIFAVLMLK
ncbi:hypothetical protein ACFW04_005435 [Cataglyphis niger]